MNVIGYVVTLLLSMPGPLVPAANTELLLAFGALHQGMNAPLLVLCAALGQMTTALICYALGERTLARWGYLARKLQSFTLQKRDRLKHGATASLVAASLLGLPPMVILAPVCSTLGYPALRVALIIFTGRVVRFGAWMVAVLAGWNWVG